MSLPPGFKLETAADEDMEECFAMLIDAHHNDELWQIMVKDCDKKDVLPWMIKAFSSTWSVPNFEKYKIVEESSGRIIAWAGLQFPWKYIPDLTDEMKANNKTKGLPPTMPGLNMEVFTAMGEARAASIRYGYNPEEDFHRRATHVHPDFQRRGFGTFLVRAWNEVTDGFGARVWCCNRPSSIKMYRDNGYAVLGVEDSHLERFGGSREGSIGYITLRQPCSSDVAKEATTSAG